MKMSVLATVLAVAAAFSPSARAEEARHLVGTGGKFLVGGVSNQPFVFGAMAFDPGLVVGLGFGLSYDSSLPSDNTSVELIGHVSYYTTNKANFAMGPELFIIFPTVPNVPAGGANLVLQPGWALWYAPFSAPVLLGAAVDFALTFNKEKAPGAGSFTTLNLLMPALRLAYAF